MTGAGVADDRQGEGGAQEPVAGLPAQTRLLRTLTLGAILLLLGATAALMWLERNQELEAASGQAERQAMRLAEDLLQTLALAKVAIGQAEARLQQVPAGAPLAATGADAHARVAELLAVLPLPFELHALGADGRVIELGGPRLGQARRVDERFHDHTGSTAAAGAWQVGLTQGPPNARFVPLVWPAAPNAHAVAAYAVDVTHRTLLKRFEADRPARGGGAALFRVEPDGSATVLVRAPLVEAELGLRVRGPLVQALARSPSGTFEGVTQIDGVRRIVAYRRLTGDAASLVVAYGTATDDVLAAWYATRPVMVALTLLLAAGFGYGGWRLERALRAQSSSFAALQRSEQHFRSLAGNVPDVVVRMDRDGRHLYANPAVERATGLPPEAFIGKTNAELGMPARNVADWMATLGRVFDSGRAERLEFSFPGPGGLVHWESQVLLEPATAGNAPTALVISRDVTARLHADAKLRASEARLAHLLRSAPTVIYTAQPHGVYGATYYSPNLQSMLGWKAEQFLEDPAFWLAHVHPGDRDDVLTQMDLLPQRGEVVLEYRFAHADGSWRWMRDAARLVRDDAGEPLELVGSWIDITERRAAEAQGEQARQEALAARNLMHDVLERVDDGFVALDRSWHYTYLNTRGARLLGRERPQDLIGRHIWTEFPEGLGQPFHLAYEQALQSQQPVMLEQHFAPWDKWFENRIYPSPDGLSIYFTDITLRKRAEAALKDSERLLRHFFDSGLVGMAITEPDKHWGQFNARLCEILGYSAEQLRQQTWADITHPDDLAADVAHFERLLAGESDGYQMEKRFIRGDATLVDAAIAVRCQRDETGKPLRFYAIVEDIGARKRAEVQLAHQRDELERLVQLRTAELSRSEARYRNIFEMVPVSIGEEDWSAVQRLLRELRASGVSDGPAYFAAHPAFVEQCLRAVRVQRLNRKALSLHDAHDKDSDLPDLQAVYPTRDELPQFVGELEALWAGERIHTAKKSLPSLTGRPLRLMLTMSLPGLDDADGTALVCLVDISEIDRLNAELDHSLSRLRQVNQELETFTYSVSHDLKAPLRGIDGYSRLLLTEHSDQLDDEGREFLGHIRQATRHMGELIDDLLAYSRLERRDLTLTEVPLAGLVDSVLAGYRHELSERDVQLDVKVPDGLRARSDVQGLTMALRNLLDNALKFSRASQPPRLEVAATRIDGCVRLTVSDNGMGFDMKFHDRIFAIFQRLHRAEEYPGTGVGLAIVRKAMERMGGRVWAHSQPGRGATFTLELPEAP